MIFENLTENANYNKTYEIITLYQTLLETSELDLQPKQVVPMYLDMMVRFLSLQLYENKQT